MSQLHLTHLPRYAAVSPMILADRLLSLAEDADRAGFSDTAERLLHLVYSVFDEKPAMHKAMVDAAMVDVPSAA